MWGRRLPGRPDPASAGAVVGAVSVGHFFSHLCFVAFPPLFPLLVDEFGVSYAEVGLLVSALYGAMFLFQIPLGWAVDRGGAKRVLVAGVLLTGGGLLGASAATSYLALLAFAFVSGLGQSTFHPANYALLDVVSPEERTGRSFSLHTFAGYAGSGAAPVVVGGLGLAYGWRVGLLAVGVAGVVYAAVVQVGIDPVYADDMAAAEASTDGGPGLRADVRGFLRPALVAMTLFFVAVVVAESGVQAFTVVFLLESFGLSEATGNLALTAFFALAALGVLAGGVLADRYDSAAVVVAGLVAATALTYVLGARLVPATAVAAVSLFGAVGFAYGVVMPSRDRLIAAVSPDDSVGRSFGVAFTGAAVGGFVGPALVGAAIDARTAAVSMPIVGAFFLAGAAVVAGLRAASWVANATRASARE